MSAKQSRQSWSGSFCAGELRAWGHAGRVGTFDGSTSEVATCDPRVSQQFLGAALQDDLAAFQNVGTVGVPKGQIGHLLDQQNGFTGSSQFLDDLEYLLDEQWCKPERRF